MNSQEPPRDVALRQMQFSRRAALALGALIAAPMLAHHGSTEAAMTVEDFEGRVSIDGRGFYVESRGLGAPTVVFEAGAGGRSDVWSRDLIKPIGTRTMVLPGVSEFTHVFTYDRPGTIGEVNPELDPTSAPFYPSRSDPARQPRTIRDMVDDLHATLVACEVPGPYVLVGHSFGGLSMRLFASTFPDEVVGLVLIDATSETVYDEFRKAMTPDQWEVFDRLSVQKTELLAAYPDAEILLTSPIDKDPSFAQMIDAEKVSPLRPMPLFVLSHGIPFPAPFPGWPTDKMEAIMADLQARQARLVPNARHVVAEKSGHNIHQDQPELVIDAIRQVVDAVRDPSTWTSAATPVASPRS
ncbi:MAG: alpha/beta hydrolase [Thermomicrobiales bacterium]